ncbi:MAG: sugar ABC transporter permease [Alphaproteobacteria bacterium]
MPFLEKVFYEAQRLNKGLKSQLTKTRVQYAWLFIAPTLVTLLLVAGWPLVRTIWFSMTDASLNSMEIYRFVGFENFSMLIQDSGWWRAVRNTLTFATISVALELTLGLGIALILNAHFKGRAWVRTAMLIPWAIPTIVSAKMWRWMFNDVYGVVNHILVKVGILAKPVAWMADPDLAMATIILVDVWKTTPFMALLLLAGLQMLPQECFEAARIDGIHPLRVFWRVTLPLLKPAIIVAMVFRTIDALRVFDLIYILTSGSRDTMSMSVYARQQLFDFQNVGLGSAAATFLFLIMAIISIAFLTAGRMKSDMKEDR